jgi:hypothetical protein
MNIDREPHDHEELHAEWKELCALSTRGALDPSEVESLEQHLVICEDCRLVYRQYHLLATEGMPFLASLAGSPTALDAESEQWDPSSVQRQLFEKIDQIPAPALTLVPKRVQQPGNDLWRWGVAAALMLGVGLGGYQLGRRSPVVPRVAPPATENTAQLQQAMQQRAALDQQIAVETQHATEIEKALAASRDRVTVLESDLHDLDLRSKSDQAALSTDATQLQSLQTDRETLTAQLHSARQAYQAAQAQFVALQQQRSQDSLHYASLEVEVSDLTRRLDDAEARDNNDSQYLASDRDIRELMGARQLYIADVLDMDTNGEKRKPFGRIFYTKGKSLIFYAFDLDQQPKVRDVSDTSFQAWAREGSDNAKPVSLGIFYVDSEANRRWVLKAEDPKTLAQINAVFVTVEPKGGSQRPSGKQLLYAYLRSASPNHP